MLKHQGFSIHDKNPLQQLKHFAGACFCRCCFPENNSCRARLALSCALRQRLALLRLMGGFGQKSKNN
ncbi:hypothetical protein [Rheinheimera sp. 4Y26]|uniref:hypothetical protein n=1 Tax=Rheinheimera sp. 4Y26 TaxID=2977811 RepID=UPI0021B10AA9|nr:hypothetical protein [Rheinheimera sp. 4Y26]MCT6698641.1 hypothetical protein [Rheinheimera sp. 4Y26]